MVDGEGNITLQNTTETQHTEHTTNICMELRRSKSITFKEYSIEEYIEQHLKCMI